VTLEETRDNHFLLEEKNYFFRNEDYSIRKIIAWIWIEGKQFLFFCLFFFDFTFIGVAAEVQEYVEEPWQFVATPM